jgi:RNA polymerase sigma factor (sigma-70 family)
MHDDQAVVALVAAARDGDRDAWGRIVERYAPLVWAICRRFNLERADCDDVGQTVWLRLFEHLTTIREPAALPGWLASTTRRECLRVRHRAARRDQAERLAAATDEQVDLTELGRDVERARRHIALRDGYAQLALRCRELLALLFADPPTPYLQISSQLDMKVGSIGPTRERCLAALRRTAALAELIEQERHYVRGEVDAR